MSAKKFALGMVFRIVSGMVVGILAAMAGFGFLAQVGLILINQLAYAVAVAVES